MVEAVHVGDPTLTDPKRTVAPEVTKQNVAMFEAAVNAGKPAAAAAPATPTGANEPPRSDVPSAAPTMSAPEGGSGLGVSVVNAPSGDAAADPNAVVKPVGPTNTALPSAEGPAAAPDQMNDIKPGEAPKAPANAANARRSRPRPTWVTNPAARKRRRRV